MTGSVHADSGCHLVCNQAAIRPGEAMAPLAQIDLQQVFRVIGRRRVEHKVEKNWGFVDTGSDLLIFYQACATPVMRRHACMLSIRNTSRGAQTEMCALLWLCMQCTLHRSDTDEQILLHGQALPHTLVARKRRGPGPVLVDTAWQLRPMYHRWVHAQTGLDVTSHVHNSGHPQRWHNSMGGEEYVMMVHQRKQGKGYAHWVLRMAAGSMQASCMRACRGLT